jgi:hypothetical protein
MLLGKILLKIVAIVPGYKHHKEKFQNEIVGAGRAAFRKSMGLSREGSEGVKDLDYDKLSKCIR